MTRTCRRRSVVCGLCLALAIPALLAGQAKPSGGVAVSRDWKRIRSENFVAEGTANTRSLQRWLDNLETFRACLQKVFPTINLTSSVPNRIIVIDGQRELLALAPLQPNGRPDPKVAGYFMPLADVNYFVVGGESDYAESTLYHEYAHFVLHNAVRGPIAGWLNEGFAEFYSTFAINRNKREATIGLASQRLGVMRDGYLIPLNKIITDEGEAEYRRDDLDIQRFYAQSWAMFHYLAIGHAGKRDGQLLRYIDAYAAGKPAEAAFQDAFQPANTLHFELKDYLTRRSLPALLVALPERESAMSGPEPMFDWESQVSRGRLLTSQGRLDEADKLLSPAREVVPDDEGVLHAMAALRRAQKRPDETVALLKPVVARQTGSFGVRLEYAQGLTDVGQHSAAIDEYRQAARINSRAASLWFGLSVSLAAVDKQDESDAALSRVRALDADPGWIRARATAAWRHGIDKVVVGDTFRFTQLAGYKSESGTYAGFLGFLSARRIKDVQSTGILLRELEAAIKPRTWPASVLAFFQGKLTPAALLDRADGNGELTEAHAYIGLVASIDGKDQDALPHLQWVVDGGSRNYIEYGLVLDEIVRRGLPIRASGPGRR